MKTNLLNRLSPIFPALVGILCLAGTELAHGMEDPGHVQSLEPSDATKELLKTSAKTYDVQIRREISKLPIEIQGKHKRTLVGILEFLKLYGTIPHTLFVGDTASQQKQYRAYFFAQAQNGIFNFKRCFNLPASFRFTDPSEQEKDEADDPDPMDTTDSKDEDDDQLKTNIQALQTHWEKQNATIPSFNKKQNEFLAALITMIDLWGDELPKYCFVNDRKGSQHKHRVQFFAQACAGSFNFHHCGIPIIIKPTDESAAAQQALWEETLKRHYKLRANPTPYSHRPKSRATFSDFQE